MENAAPLNAHRLIESSQRTTGVGDPMAPDFVEGLEVLVRDLLDNGQLNAIGIHAQQAGLTNMLCNRLRLDALFRKHPEITDEVIHSPVIIIGMPRSGTTKMQRMLAASGEFQYLPLWQILNPAPIQPVSAGRDDPRIAMAEQAMAAMKDAFPEFYAGHPMDAKEADEEVFMADLVMRGWNPCYSANVPVYEAWLEAQDFGIWYDYLKKLLQLFQWQNQSTKPWLLKTCEHLPYLDHLFRVFPDATVVHCHRDPVTTIASLGALTGASWRMNSDHVDPTAAANFVFEHMTKQMAGYMKRRPELEDRFQFVDIGYPEIVGNVQDVIHRISQTAGLDLSAQARQNMAEWEQDNPPGKHGSHHYSLPQLGLSEPAIKHAVAPYLARFSHYM
jgi:Sulfotransferase family